MKEQTSGLKSTFSFRWLISLPFIAAMIVFAFMVWTMLQLWGYPHDGIGNLSPTGLITDIQPSGPSYQKLENEDRIVQIDGVPWAEGFAPYRDKKGGDQVEFLVDRQGATIPVTITLLDPPFEEVTVRLVPIIIALVFWLIGMGVQTFKPPDGAAALFFYWCQLSALTLSAGAASYLGPIWTSVLFNSTLWALGPLSVHFHLNFPQPTPWRGKHWLLTSLYIIAAMGIAAHLAINIFYALPGQLPALLPSLVRIFLGVNLLIVVWLLFYNYGHSATPGARGKIRLVALGGGLSGFSIVVLTILPDGLFHQPLLPYRFTFLLLAIIPATYSFAIYRFHLIEIEEHVNRGATYFLIYSVMGGVYLVFYALLSNAFRQELLSFTLLNGIVVLFLVYMFFPLRNWMERFVDTIFYGGWYDYRIGVMKMTQSLDEINDLHELAKTISERLVDIINLEESCAFLRGTDGDFSVIEVASCLSLNERPPRSYPILPRSSLTYLLKMGAVERNYLRKALSEVTVTPEELQLLNSEQIHLWVPIVGHEQILGLLALGPKLGGDVFSGDDLDIMRVLARQMGPTIEKLHLLTRLRNYTAELEQRVSERTEELYNSKEKVEAILASVGDGVIVSDLDGKIVMVNPAFEKQSGYSAIDLIGRPFDLFLAGSDNENQKSEWVPILQEGGVWTGELSSRRKSGEMYDVRVIIAPVKDLNGRITSYVASQMDITRQKELERMKDTFVADVSHELRTPTTNISLYLDLLERAKAEKQQQYITVLKEQSRELVNLVEDILDLSRLTRTRRQRGGNNLVDLNLLVDQVISAHQPMAEASSLQLRFKRGEDLPELVGEQTQIARLINNLVSNAIRYTSHGEVCIATLKFENMLGLSVSDTGVGIEEEDLPHIFERFYRGKNVRQSNTPGTGLGLAIVKEIVELHKGKIDIISEPGRGSTFTVWFPTRITETS